jgi:sterol desaturase/sphingolipid hydroxylase (fatty acid hydroxylase superfamily)
VDTFHKLLKDYYHSFLSVLITLVIAFVLFAWLEKMFTFSKRKKSFRANLLDLQYVGLAILFPPTIYFVIAYLLNVLSIKLTAGTPDLAVWQWIGEFLLFLFMRDILIYLRHRIFHTRKVWAFHSIHHSSEEVNWLSAARFHPAESSIETTGEFLLFLVAIGLGMNLNVLSVASTTIGFYNLFVHANINWTFGPLRYILVSPVFHRWHHSDSAAAHDKNFAAMFSCLDLMLGTYYMPKNKLPDTLGLSPAEKKTHPWSLWQQLAYPFKKTQKPTQKPTQKKPRRK